MRTTFVAALVVGLVGCGAACAQDAPAAQALIRQMAANENAAALHKPLYEFQSVEKSERTQEHLWTERVVETPAGRVRFLIAIDGQPLSPEREQAERDRLAKIVAEPSEWERAEAAEKQDEAKARDRIEMFGTGFLLDGPKAEGEDWRIDFKPDPSYTASGIEAKVLHGMNGYMLISRKDGRLKHVEAALPADMSVAFGMATVHAGSHFESDKSVVDGFWHTTHVVSDIRVKAALVKNLSKNMDVTRTQFHRVPEGLTLEKAVALAEQGQGRE